MERDSLKNLFTIHFIIGVIAIIIKLIKPEYSSFNELLLALTHSDGISLLFIGIIFMFILFTFITYGLGLYVVYSQTIAKWVRIAKDFVCDLLHIPRKYDALDYDNDDVKYTYLEVNILLGYLLLVIPIILYILLPSMCAVLGIVFILFIIMAIFN